MSPRANIAGGDKGHRLERPNLVANVEFRCGQHVAVPSGGVETKRTGAVVTVTMTQTLQIQYSEAYISATHDIAFTA